MLQVSPLKDVLKDKFAEMFEAYYKELGCDEDGRHIAEEYIIPDLLAGLLKIDILREDGEAAGFVIYQKDEEANDWNFKEGWGDVREIYIARKFRGKGAGKFLLYTAEMKLKESGVERAYCLPNLAGESFFKACGYKKTEEYCADLDSFVFEKLDLNNCECHKK